MERPQRPKPRRSWRSWTARIRTLSTSRSAVTLSYYLRGSRRPQRPRPLDYLARTSLRSWPRSSRENGLVPSSPATGSTSSVSMHASQEPRRHWQMCATRFSGTFSTTAANKNWTLSTPSYALDIPLWSSPPKCQRLRRRVDGPVLQLRGFVLPASSGSNPLCPRGSPRVSRNASDRRQHLRRPVEGPGGGRYAPEHPPPFPG